MVSVKAQGLARVAGCLCFHPSLLSAVAAAVLLFSALLFLGRPRQGSRGHADQRQRVWAGTPSPLAAQRDEMIYGVNGQKRN